MTTQTSGIKTGPDWCAVVEEIHCPLCDYNLRGLEEPRCPECGYAFAWPEVLDWRLRRHPYLFEHHPQGSVGSFIRTIRGGMKPWRFWRELHPAQPSDPWRLAIYFLAGILILLLPIVDLAVVGVPEMDDGWPIYRNFINLTGTPKLVYTPLRHTRYLTLILAPIACLVALPLLNVFFLCFVFQVSMARARIRAIHVFRCIIYSFDVVVPASLLMLATVAINQAPAWAGYHTRAALSISAVWAMIVWPIFTVRLWLAYSEYLRFHAPLATVLAAQLLTLMSMFAVAVNIQFMQL